MASSSRNSTGSSRRSLSPSATNQSLPGFASTTISSPSSFFNRISHSPTSLNVDGQSFSASSIRFSPDGRISPARSATTVGVPSKNGQIIKNNAKPQKRTCMCSPTTHPGSFRCSLHKGIGGMRTSTKYSSNNALNARRSAMTNSLVRIGGVEGELVKRALSALIRPSSHHQRRRANFQPRPSRLSVMSKAGDS